MNEQLIFTRELTIRAPIDHVWQLVATEAGLRQWWGNTIHLDAKEGGSCEEWRTDVGGTMHWQGTVTHYAPPHQIAMTLRCQTESHERSAHNSALIPALTTITITLEASGNHTHVHVIQRAFGAASAIGTDRDAVTEPANSYRVPLAQLDQPAPGVIPSVTTVIRSGNIDPVALVTSHAQSEALRQLWEQRVATLIANFSTNQRAG